MDSVPNILHYLNMNEIPTYALYGEAAGERQQDWLHWETIQARSRLHDYRIVPHRHERFMQVLHLVAGEGEVVLDGRRTALRPDSVVIVPTGTIHGYSFSRDVRGVVVTLIERDLEGLGLPRPDATAVVGDCGEVGAALKRLTGEADRPGPGHDVAMRAHLMLLLVALRRVAKTGFAEHGATRSRQIAGQFRDVVELRFRTSRRVSDYAAELGISHTHLNRICREVFRQPPLALIEQRVALEARRQLLFTTLSVKQIGAQLGYDDPAYFTRFITRLFGSPPATLRRQMLGG